MLANKGYTMVEILVVLCIVISLSLLCVPVLKSAVHESEIKKGLLYSIEKASYRAMNEGLIQKVEISKNSLYVNGVLQYNFKAYSCTPNTIVFHANGHVSGPMILKCFLGNKEIRLKYSLGTGIYYE